MSTDTSHLVTVFDNAPGAAITTPGRVVHRDTLRADKVPKNEREANTIGRGGFYAHPDTPAHLAAIQDQTAAAVHRSPPNNIDFNNTINMSSSGIIDLDIAALREAMPGGFAKTNSDTGN